MCTILDVMGGEERLLYGEIARGVVQHLSLWCTECGGYGYQAMREREIKLMCMSRGV